MRFHIVARDIQRHDAVGNFCRQMAALLRARDAEVRLAAENCHPDDRAAIDPLPDAIDHIAPDDVVFFHFSTEDPALARVAALPNPKVFYFHNITPEHFFSRSDPHLAGLVRRGLAQRPLAARFDVLMANSRASAGVLHEGLSRQDRRRIARADIVVCPPIVGVDRWSGFAPEPVPLPAMDRFVLSVGRLAPHKGVDKLLAGFAALAETEAAIGLVVVGPASESDYARQLKADVARLSSGIRRRVTFLHAVTDGALRFLYERAGVYASMSAHEGFGVPLVDAMVFDKPLVICAESAMMETAGPAALVVDHATRGPIAAALRRALSDDAVAARLAAARARRLAELRELANGRLILDAAAAAGKSMTCLADSARRGS
jgi:glycosyltransferase involved in cell wall biosynthesis